MAHLLAGGERADAAHQQHAPQLVVFFREPDTQLRRLLALHQEGQQGEGGSVLLSNRWGRRVWPKRGV